MGEQMTELMHEIAELREYNEAMFRSMCAVVHSCTEVRAQLLRAERILRENGLHDKLTGKQ